MIVTLIAGLTLAALPTHEVLTRSQWGAKPPVLQMASHEIRFLTIHHAGVATKAGVSNVQKLRNLQSWCQRADKLASGKEKPAWPDIPYHYYIFRDGQIAECRDWRYVGDTNTEYDPKGHLLVCVEGDFDTEQPSQEQLSSLAGFAESLRLKHGLLRIDIGAHCDYAKTSCPGRNLLPAVLALRSGRAQVGGL